MIAIVEWDKVSYGGMAEATFEGERNSLYLCMLYLFLIHRIKMDFTLHFRNYRTNHFITVTALRIGVMRY